MSKVAKRISHQVSLVCLAVILAGTVTAGGSPETFRLAGEIGANLLTHLLGQNLDQLSEKILIFQGDGDYEGVVAFMEEYGSIRSQLQADLDRLAEAGIPVDIVYEQGLDVLGLGG